MTLSILKYSCHDVIVQTADQHRNDKETRDNPNQKFKGVPENVIKCVMKS